MAPGLDLSILADEIEQPDALPLPLAHNDGAHIASTLISHDAIVRHPSLITTEFDCLRFEAASFGQLLLSQPTIASSGKELSSEPNLKLSSLLISSPYNNPGHYLDLRDLDAGSQIFSKALTALKPARPDYATAYYTDALNFPEVLSLVGRLSEESGFRWKEQSFYVVVFRSRLKEGTDNELLYKLDYESHREACESGGLLKYWFGKINGERRNLATCFWRSRQDAHQGGLGPWHKKARMAARELYETITFATHKFTILDDASGFVFEDWVN